MRFNKITFANEILTIFPVVGESVNYNLLTTPISIRVESSEELGGIWEAFIDTTPTSSDYISSIPFGDVNDLAELKFGRINSVIDYGVQTLRTSDVELDYTLAVKPAFYMVIIGESKDASDDTIGTDDMRNGMANVNIFSLEGENGVYLKLVKTIDKYNLEVGYEKNP